MSQRYVMVRDKTWYVGRTAVSLESVIRLHDQGLHPGEIQQRLPELTLEQVYGSIAWYLGHQSVVAYHATRAQPQEVSRALTQALRRVLEDPAKRAKLDEWKQAARKYEEPDFIWEALLLSLATMGNSRGAVLVKNPELHVRVRYDLLHRMSPPARRHAISDALRDAQVRMPDRKTEWLAENFDRIDSRGGCEAVKAQLEAFAGRAAKIAFLKTFRGIGEKCARNLMMDVYHPDFRDSIAIDERIGKITTRLGLAFPSYRQEEAFYLEVAEAAGLEGWELDRLLYNFTDDVMAALASK